MIPFLYYTDRSFNIPISRDTLITLNALRHFTLLITAVCCSVNLFAQEVVIGFGKNKAPFVVGESGEGLEIDIFKEALAFSGHTLKTVHIDNKGLLPILVSGRVDGIATARDPENRFCHVDKFIAFDNVAISLKSRDLKINQVSDLASSTLVAWENAYQDLGPEFNALFKPDKNNLLPVGYFENRNQQAQNAMFWAGRVDLIIVDKTIFAWYRKQLAESFDTDQEVQYHAIFGEKTYFPALFKDKSMCEDFKKGLGSLKERKQYQKLFEKYTQ